MPHARSDAPLPKRKRKPAPPQRPGTTPLDAPAAYPHAHTYYPEGRLSTPTSTLDRILAAGAGPLALPEGKINIPRRSAAPPRLSLPVIEPPAAGAHNATPTYQSLFGRGGQTVVPPATQAMLEHATGNKHQHDSAQYLLDAQNTEDLHKRAVELGFDPTSDLNNLVHAIDSTFGEPTHNIAGFPQTGRTALPDWQRKLLLARGHAYEQQSGKNLHLPDNPTDQDIVRYSFGVARHTGSYWDVLKNLPKDAIETPLYAYEGGAAANVALWQALHGNYAPAREIGAQQIDAIRHPGAFVQEHPFQAVLAGATAASRAGAFTARARGVGITPRDVPTRYGSTINRGVSPANDYVRGIQGVQDFLTRPHEGAGRVLNPLANKLQDSGLRKNLRQIDRQHRSQQGLDTQALEQRVEDTKNKLTRAQQERVLSHEAMGFTPTDIARTRGTEPATTKPLSPAEDAYRQALEDYRRSSETAMMDAGMLGSGARLHREVDPLAQVRAAHGDPLAQRYLDANSEIDQFQTTLDRHPSADLEGQIHQALADRNQILQDLLAKHVAEGGTPPIRVPLNEANPRQGLFTRSGAGPGSVKRRGQRQYTGARFQSGNFETPTHDLIMRDIRAPLNAQTYHRVANHVLDPENGVATVAEPGALIPEDMVLVRPAQRVPPHATLETVRPGETIFKRLDFHASQVPAGDGYALVPRVVAEEIKTRGEQVGKGRPGGKISQGLRNVLLYSRPSYALTNLVGNVQQGLFEGTGPLSYIRAGRNNLPLPAGVEEGGAVRANFSAYGAALADKINGQNPIHAAATVLGHPIAAYTQLMRHAAQSVEDFTRRGTYFKNAIPAARDIAHTGESGLQRFLASFKGVDDATRRVLEEMARGDGTPGGAVDLAAKDAIQRVDRVLGDYASLPSNAVVDIALPFHRWAQFASRLLAVTLPVHYPGRALILYRLGALGQEAQNQVGPLTPSLQGIVPVGNDPQDILALNTSYPNTFATLGEALAPDPRGGSEILGLNPKGAASYLSPIARTIQALVTGVDPTTGFVFTNPRGEGIITSDRDHPADPNATSDFLRFVAGQALSTVPPLRLAFSPANPADTSIPLPGLTQSRYQPPVAPWAVGRQAPQTQLPLGWEQRLFNFVSPFRVRRIDLAALAQQGIDQTSNRIAETQRKESR